MKKIIFILLTIVLFGTTVFAVSINVGTGSIDKTIILDEGKNSLSTGTGVNIINFYKGNNKVLTQTYYNDLTVNCKNGYIEYLSGNKTVANNTTIGENIYSKKVSQLVLGIKVDNTWNNTIVKCKPIAQPSQNFTAMNINYETINQKDAYGTSFSVSKENIAIAKNDVEDRMNAGKSIDNQPTFTDILFLQLKVIDSLSDSVLLTKDASFSFSGMFVSSEKYDQYKTWTDKFSTFNNKQLFQDAFSGAITMKDLAIAQNIVLGLYKCKNDNQCLHIIDFKNPNDKYDLYSLKYIEDNLYSGNTNILDDSIAYFNSIKNDCNGNNITDSYLKTQVNNICSLIVKNNVETSENTVYHLGYALGQRIENLNNIKNNIGTGGVNLLGIYNIYWEINNLNLGTSKIEIIKKVNQESDNDTQYYLFRKIFENELQEINNSAVDNVIDETAVLHTKMELFTKGTALYDEAKTKSANLLDPSIYNVNDGVVQIDGFITTLNDNKKDSASSSDIDSLELERKSSWPYYYNNLKVAFAGDSTVYDYHKVIMNFSSGKYSLGDEWIYPQGTYIDKDKENDINGQFGDCYEDEENWSKLGGWKYLNDNYDDCIDGVIERYDRVVINCNLIGGCYGEFRKGNGE